MIKQQTDNRVRGSWKSWLFLALVVLFVVFVRVRLLGVPLERDEGEYAYMGQLILQGIPPYIGAYNMKFPGTYAMYALIMSVFGQNMQGIHFGVMLINCATIVLVFLLARRFLSDAAAVGAGAAYAFLSLSPSVLGFAGHATHFVVLPALGGVLALLYALRSGKGHGYFWSGLLFGLAVLMKQPGVFFFLFGATYIIYHHFFLIREARSKIPSPFPAPKADALEPPSSPRNPTRPPLSLRGGEGGVISTGRRGSYDPEREVADDRVHLPRGLASKLVTFTIGGAVPLVIALIYIYAAGAFGRFWFWTFEYAAQYATQVPLSTAFSVFKRTVSEVTEAFPLLWLMPIPGFVGVFFLPGLKGKRVFIVLFSLFSFLTICPGFHFRPHYFITLLPALAILTGIFIEWLNVKSVAMFKTEYVRFAGTLLFVLAAGIGIAGQRSYLFEETPMELSRIVYGGNPFPESLEIAKFIKSHSAATDRVAVFGSEPQIFFYSGRHLRTRNSLSL
jgi:4-amino-4-deoxy-L-arabinose transferase-like glycosyltransferase